MFSCDKESRFSLNDVQEPYSSLLKGESLWLALLAIVAKFLTKTIFKFSFELLGCTRETMRVLMKVKLSDMIRGLYVGCRWAQSCGRSLCYGFIQEVFAALTRYVVSTPRFRV